ncbi:MAG: alpha/beta hydrolase [Paracoccaceae bacterium]
MSGAGAPFYDDVSSAPRGGRTDWLTCEDGVRVRASLWPEGAKGTVLLFPGRTEYVEKYGPAALDLASRGYAMATIDWRGQGLADRDHKDPLVGHINRFADFQKDVAALVAHCRREKMPEPYYLIGHSMGGAIGLRALLRGLAVRAVVFTGPMWGIKIAPALRPAAWIISSFSRPFGLSHFYAPGTGPLTYVLKATFAENTLTRDEEMFLWMREQVTRHPDLALGGPSLHWLNEALLECAALMRSPPPHVPCYCALGTREAIVDTRPIHRYMARWPQGKLELVEGAEHEIMMETPAIRAAFFDRVAAHFAELG